MADISCGMKMVKIILFIFNVIFILVGIALVATGILAAVKFQSVVPVIGNNVIVTPVVICVLGVVIFVIAFFGCCGAIKEHRCMVLTYAVLMSVILIAEFAAAIAAFVLRGEIETVIRDDLTKAIHDQYNTSKAVQESVDYIQKTYECCGVTNSSDWISTVPQSCCKNGGTCTTSNENNIFTVGCLDKVKSLIESNILLVGGIALGVCFVELVGIMFACCLARALKDAYEPV